MHPGQHRMNFCVNTPQAQELLVDPRAPCPRHHVIKSSSILLAIVAIAIAVPLDEPQSLRGIPDPPQELSLIHISEPTRLLSISYAVFCLKKKKKHTRSKNQA
eukprot:TRINITY_DN2960_c0_g1_i2.p3 TRINITY_DN2960_c0_g1~~TRINITY_DN2960_c0_g1_i2.p3  ORF type:complete len:103 (+),score=22.78 TRINITY_DN2960_c0_g1_i2:587-895(+)